MKKEIALDGIDGSGKTTVAKELTMLLAQEGLHSVTISPFHFAEISYGSGIYGLWSTDPKKAISLLKSSIQSCRSQARMQSADVLIFDRHWMTAFTEIGDTPELVDFWGDDYVKTALLLAEPILATMRVDNDKLAPWTSTAQQVVYDHKYREIAQQFPEHILGQYRNSPDVTPHAIARVINWDMHILR